MARVLRLGIAAHTIAVAFATTPSARGSVHEQVRELYLEGGSGIDPQFFDAPVDHFDHTQSSTFAMRYWVDDSFWNGATPIVLLAMGGEGASGPPGGQMAEFAREWGALQLSIEHRFYGESSPARGYGELRLLGVEQALADAAAFVRFATGALRIPAGARWITFGGSYSGELAAWMRIRYPHLVYGAFASSAPVTASADFWGYDGIVAAALADASVGGSAACAEAVADAFAQLDARLDSDVAAVRADFAVCAGDDLATAGDRHELLDFVSDDFMGPVQYNDFENGAESKVGALCRAMLNATAGAEPYDRLASVTRARLAPGECVSASWAGLIAEMRDPTYAGRAWPWQMCADGSGHDQTCHEHANCPFIPRYATFAQFQQMCFEAYNTTNATMSAALAANSAAFGDNSTLGVSRVIFINGDNDPFSWGSVTVNSTAALERDVVALVARAGSHCADMGASSDYDTPSMAAVKQAKAAYFAKWATEPEGGF